MIIIINGPCGVGKTSISRELALKLNNSININVDELHNFITNSEIVAEQIDITDENVKCLVKNFTNSGYKNIIIDEVYETKTHILSVINSLKQFDEKVIAIRVYCKLDDNILRDGMRAIDDVMGDKRVKELYSIFQNKNEIGEIIDTIDLSVEQSTDLLYKFICNL